MIGGSEHALKEIQQASLATEYFNKFKSLSVVGSGQRNKAQKCEALRAHWQSRPNWESAVDEVGRSAFFYALRADPSVLRDVVAASVSRDARVSSAALAMLRHRDHQGLGVWFYLLPVQSNITVTSKLLRGLAAVVPRPSSWPGSSWLVNALSDPAEAFERWSLPPVPEEKMGEAGYIDNDLMNEAWQDLAASPGELEKMAKGIMQHPELALKLMPRESLMGALPTVLVLAKLWVALVLTPAAATVDYNKNDSLCAFAVKRVEISGLVGLLLDRAHLDRVRESVRSALGKTVEKRDVLLLNQGLDLLEHAAAIASLEAVSAAENTPAKSRLRL